MGQHNAYYSLQETHTHSPLLTLGQPHQFFSMIQCIQHPHTQGWASLHYLQLLYPCAVTPLALWRLRARYNLKQSDAQSKPKARGNNNASHNIHMVVLYTKGLSESVKNIRGKACIQVHFGDSNAIKALLKATKDKDNITQKSRVIYRYKCDSLECGEEYKERSARNFKEHLRTPYPIYDHANMSGHHNKLDNFSIVGRESQTTTRTIKEAMLIRVNNPSLNRNIGKFQLPHILDKVLLNTCDPHLK